MSTATDRPQTAPPDAELERIALRSTLPPAAKNPSPSEPRKLMVPGMDDSEIKPRNRLPDVARPDLAFSKEEAEPTKADGPADLDRAGFPNRAMFPEAVACGLLTWGWLYGVMPFLPASFQVIEVYASIPGTYGLFVVVKWLFRYFAGGYRLTATEILRVIPGPISDPPPIDLASIASVTVAQTPLEWLLLVGRVRLSFERDTQPDEFLGPVGWPKWRAKKVEDALAAARDGGVTTRRTAA